MDKYNIRILCYYVRSDFCGVPLLYALSTCNYAKRDSMVVTV